MNPLIKVFCLTIATLAGCTSENLDTGTSKNLDVTGEWVAVSMEGDGESLGAASDTFFIVFSKDVIATRTSTPPTSYYSYAIHHDTVPRHIDIAALRVRELAGKGIIELRNGQLRICLVSDPILPRPTSFTTKEGDGRVLYVLERTEREDDDESESEMEDG